MVICAPVAAEPARIAFSIIRGDTRYEVPVADQPDISAVPIFDGRRRRYRVLATLAGTSRQGLCELTRTANSDIVSIAVGCEIVVRIVVPQPICEGQLYIATGLRAREAAILLQILRDGSAPCPGLPGELITQPKAEPQ